MKKTLFVLTFILVITNISAQLHEIKINVLDVIAYKSFNATYQYVLNEESGVGVSVYFPLAEEENIFSQNEKLTFTPFYRHYFNNAFAEAFFAINSGEGKNKEDEIVTYTDGGFGFAIGKSYISDRGLVAEAFIGAGRNLFEAEGAPDYVPRVGINIGYRF